MIKTGELGKQNVLWSGLITGAVKFDKHEVGVTFLKAQNGIKEAAQRISQDYEETRTIFSYVARAFCGPGH